MQEADYFYMEAQFCIDSFIDVSLADAFFEDTDEAKNATENNQKASKGAIGALKKLFDKLIQLVKDCIEKLRVFFETRCLSAAEKKAYAEFRQMVKSQPELANKKITIQDWKAYEKAYDDALKAIEEEAKKENPSEERAKAILSKLEEEVKHAATRAALSVSMHTAVEIADKNTDCAKGINFTLKHELVSLESVRKELGDAEAERFQNKIQKLSKKGFLHRWRIRIFHKKEANLEAILRNEMKRILSFTNIDEDGELKKGKNLAVDTSSVLKGAVKNPKLFSDTVGGKENAVKAAAGLVAAKTATSVATTTAKNIPKLAKSAVGATKVVTYPVRKHAEHRAKDLKDFFTTRTPKKDKKD